jgi:hypothetical protein
MGKIVLVLVSLTVAFTFKLCSEEEKISEVLKIYMSSDGNNLNSGLKSNNSVLTLTKVQELLYGLSPITDIEIHIKQGTYLNQEVVWNFVNGKKITFMAIDTAGGKPLFDGGGKKVWFTLQKKNGVNTNLIFKNIKVRNYRMGVNLSGSKDNPNAWNGNNHFEGMYFENIGSKHAKGQSPGFAAIKMNNSRNNSVVNSTFMNIENKEKKGLIHALYLAHYSSNNIVKNNQFINVSGDVIRTRNESNYNIIESNEFTEAGKIAFYSDWYCSSETKKDCTRLERPSYGNVFKNNVCDTGYNSRSIQFVKLNGVEGCCKDLPEKRLKTSGNIQKAKY